MTIFRKTTLILTLCLLASCGSSERVITDDGKVYEVKGNTIENNGIEVTDNLTEAEKAAINDRIKIREKAQSAAEEEQKTLEKAIEKQKQIQDEAKAKQKEFEAKLDALQNKLKEAQDARDNYAEIKKSYNEELKAFEKLKNNGELSPKEIKMWEEKLNKLKSKVEKTKSQLNRFN